MTAAERASAGNRLQALVARRGPRPRTRPRTPHVQIDQFAPARMQAQLWERMSALPDVRVGPSLVSAPSSRALHLPDETAAGPRDAFMVGTEFAHLHGDGSGSLHLAVPHPVVDHALELGWGEPHPAVSLGIAPATSVMLFGPRDDEELELVWNLVLTSYRYARGEQVPTWA